MGYQVVAVAAMFVLLVERTEEQERLSARRFKPLQLGHKCVAQGKHVSVVYIVRNHDSLANIV